MFSVTSNMLAVRGQHTATLLLNGKVLVTGGHDGTTELKSAELYSYSTAESATVSGFIKWGSQPVAGSRIEIHQSVSLSSALLQTTVSAADGSFNFSNAPTGNLGIFAFAPSAEFWSFIGQSLQVNAGENVQNVTLRLSKILQLL